MAGVVAYGSGVVLGVYGLWLAQCVWVAYTQGLVRARTHGPGPAERPQPARELIVRLSVELARFEAAMRGVGAAAARAGDQVDAFRYAYGRDR